MYYISDSVLVNTFCKNDYELKCIFRDDCIYYIVYYISDYVPIGVTVGCLCAVTAAVITIIYVKSKLKAARVENIKNEHFNIVRLQQNIQSS